MGVLKAIFLCLFWGTTIDATQKELIPPPLQIKGAKISDPINAKHIAFEGYAKKMHGEILANEGPQEVTVIKLGFGVPDFAAALEARRASSA